MIPRISDAEWQVMQVVWRHPGLTAQEIFGALTGTEWSEATVKTLLNRLLKKGALSFEKVGKAYLYTARVSEVECQRSETKSFIQRVCGGSILPMLAHFVQNEKLTPSEVAELKELLRRNSDRS